MLSCNNIPHERGKCNKDMIEVTNNIQFSSWFRELNVRHYVIVFTLNITEDQFEGPCTRPDILYSSNLRLVLSIYKSI